MIWSRPLKLHWLAKKIRERQDNKFDCNIVVDGPRGLGKSTFALKLAYKIGGFRLKRDIVFSKEEFIQQLSTKRKGIILADEAIMIAHNREWFSQDQNKIIKMINMYRDRQNVIIFCIPNFAVLDRQLKELLQFRVNIVKRGAAVIHKPRTSGFSQDSWDTKLNESIEKSWLKRGILKPRYNRLTTFLAMTSFRPLSELKQQQYDDIKAQKRNDVIVGEQQDDKKDFKSKIYDSLTESVKNKKMTREQLQQACLQFGLDYFVVSNAIHKRLKSKGLGSYSSVVVKENNLITNNFVKKVVAPKVL